MNRTLFACVLSSLPLAACGGGGAGDAAGDVAPQSAAAYVAGVTHPYRPIVPGRVWVYEGFRDGLPAHEEVRTLEESRWIQGIRCTGIQEDAWVGGEWTESSTEWFAQDRQGNVWKFGEESFDAEGGSVTLSDDSWMTGEDGARAWKAFPAAPRVGERIDGWSPDGPEVLQVLSVTDLVVVPAGTFPGCLRLLENPDDPEDQDIILYAPGVGMVSETDPTGRIDLVSVGGTPP